MIWICFVSTDLSVPKFELHVPPTGHTQTDTKTEKSYSYCFLSFFFFFLFFIIIINICIGKVHKIEICVMG